MPQRPGRAWRAIRRTSALAVHMVLAAVLAHGWVSATYAQHSAADTRLYDIPAGPLTAALNRFADEAGIFLAGNAQLTEGKRTAGLKGRFSVREGLRQLLSGTELEAVREDSGGFALKRRTSSDQDSAGNVVDTGAAPTAGAAPVPSTIGPTVTVLGTRAHSPGPLPGLELTPEQIPGNLQSVTGAQIQDAHAVSLPALMNSQLQSVNVNDYQGNPFQMDVTYRGFTAGPQLGTPQGLSVFFDGIRVNEPFGDVVNWDLIPLNALSSFEVFPGSNPIFGLGTLGGALSMRTRSGFTDPGVSAELLGGSFGRKQLMLSAGAHNEVVAGFFAASMFDEDGWRDNSPSKVNQAFGKLEWTNGRMTLGLSTLLAGTELVGNGLIPLDLYRQRPESVFTSPDKTENRLVQFQLSGAFEVNDRFNITSQVYRRNSKRRALNGDVYGAFDDMGNDYDYGYETTPTPANNLPLCQYLDADLDGLPDSPTPLNNPTNVPGVCNPAPIYVEPLKTRNGKASGFLLQNGTGVVNGTPIGQINNTKIDQLTKGGAIQFNWNLEKHKFMIGASFDSAYADYGSTSRLALIDASHNVYADPANIDPLYFAASHDITNNAFDGTSKTVGLYFSETWSPRHNLHISAGARYNRARVNSDLKSRTAAGFTELHNMRDFAAVPDIVLCPTADPASCPSAPNATRRIVNDAQGNGNGYYRPDGKTGAQFEQGGKPEEFTYRSLNPSLGISYLPRPDLNVYGNWSQGTRTPTVIELGCALDRTPVTIGGETAPTSLTQGGACTLPSTLSGDPFLPQIKATTYELGGRGRLFGDWRWNASVFRTDLRDDIYFVGVTPTRSYFDEIGKTRRQGLELGVGGRLGRFELSLNYAFTHATFRSTFWGANLANSSTDRDINGGNAPGPYPFVFDESGEGGSVVIKPTAEHLTNYGLSTYRLYKVQSGDRIPGIPLHNINLALTYHVNDRWKMGLEMIAHSRAYARGNENNRHQTGPGVAEAGALSCDEPLFDPDTGDFTGYFQCNASGFRKRGQPFFDEGSTPGYAIFNFQTSYRVTKNLTLGLLVNNLFDRKYYTASRLGVNPFSPSIDGAIGPSGFNYNSSDWQNVTFVAPGAPRSVFLSIAYGFGTR